MNESQRQDLISVAREIILARGVILEKDLDQGLETLEEEGHLFDIFFGPAIDDLEDAIRRVINE